MTAIPAGTGGERAVHPGGEVSLPVTMTRMQALFDRFGLDHGPSSLPPGGFVTVLPLADGSGLGLGFNTIPGAETSGRWSNYTLTGYHYPNDPFYHCEVTTRVSLAFMQGADATVSPPNRDELRTVNELLDVVENALAQTTADGMQQGLTSRLDDIVQGGGFVFERVEDGALVIQTPSPEPESRIITAIRDRDTGWLQSLEVGPEDIRDRERSAVHDVGYVITFPEPGEEEEVPRMIIVRYKYNRQAPDQPDRSPSIYNLVEIGRHGGISDEVGFLYKYLIQTANARHQQYPNGRPYPSSNAAARWLELSQVA